MSLAAIVLHKKLVKFRLSLILPANFGHLPLNYAAYNMNTGQILQLYILLIEMKVGHYISCISANCEPFLEKMHGSFELNI